MIDIDGHRTLFAVADASGKGMPAALLAANIQALVRSFGDTGELNYVNAGHNAPLVFGSGSAKSLEAVGMPLGLFPQPFIQSAVLSFPPEGAPLLFTDGLTDSISGENAEDRLREILAVDSGDTMDLLKS